MGCLSLFETKTKVSGFSHNIGIYQRNLRSWLPGTWSSRNCRYWTSFHSRASLANTSTLCLPIGIIGVFDRVLDLSSNDMTNERMGWKDKECDLNVPYQLASAEVRWLMAIWRRGDTSCWRDKELGSAFSYLWYPMIKRVQTLWWRDRRYKRALDWCEERCDLEVGTYVWSSTTASKKVEKVESRVGLQSTYSLSGKESSNGNKERRGSQRTH